MNQFIIIIGYQRSGTSFLTKALNFCGVDLGNFDDMTFTHINANMANESGDWESKKLKLIYDNILNSHQTLDDLSDTTKFDNISTDIKKQIEDYLSNLSKRQAITHGFKMPNILMLKYFLDYKPVLVGTFRDPLTNVESCAGRFNSVDYRKKLYPKYFEYWKIHNKIMLDTLEQYGGYLINFNWKSERIISEIHKICDDIGLLKTDLTQWFRKDLIHSDKSRLNYPVDQESLNLHEKLIERADANEFNKTRQINRQIDSEFLKQYLKDDIIKTNLTSIAIKKIERENTDLKKRFIYRCLTKLKLWSSG